MAGTHGSQELRQVREERWRARPVEAALVRGLVLAVPLAAGIGAGLAVIRLMGDAGVGLLGLVGVLAASTAAILLTERLARRLLPLSMLLRLTLVFPDRAPARLRVALRAGNLRRLRKWAEAEHEAGVTDDAGCAAERVLSLVTALGAHDRRTRGHSERVRALVDVLGAEMHLDPADLDKLRWSGLLHDLGKLSVPSSILNKPAKPSEAEWAQLQRHPAEGIRIAGPLVAWLGEWAHGIDEHHERWDGAGYPYGLAGTEISLAGRIVAVADAFECMTEVRSYQRPRSYAQARAELARCAGSHFDPAVVRALQTMSLARLHWVMGPLSWLAQVPFLGAVPRTGMELANIASAATIGTVAQVATAAALIAGPGAAATIPGFDAPTSSLQSGEASSQPVTGPIAGAAARAPAAGDASGIVGAADALDAVTAGRTVRDAAATVDDLGRAVADPVRRVVNDPTTVVAAVDDLVPRAPVDLVPDPPVDRPDDAPVDLLRDRPEDPSPAPATPAPRVD